MSMSKLLSISAMMGMGLLSIPDYHREVKYQTKEVHENLLTKAQEKRDRKNNKRKNKERGD